MQSGSVFGHKMHELAGYYVIRGSMGFCASSRLRARRFGSSSTTEENNLMDTGSMSDIDDNSAAKHDVLRLGLQTKC